MTEYEIDRTLEKLVRWDAMDTKLYNGGICRKCGEPLEYRYLNQFTGRYIYYCPNNHIVKLHIKKGE